MITTLEHVKIEWTENTKSLITAVNVYRSETPFDMSTPPTSPLVTLDSGVLAYIDETAEMNKTYYYTVSAVVDGVEDFSIASRTVHTKDPKLIKGATIGEGWLAVGEITLDSTHGEDAGTYMVVVSSSKRIMRGNYQKIYHTDPVTPSMFSTPGSDSMVDGLSNTLAVMDHAKTTGDYPHYSYPDFEYITAFKAPQSYVNTPDLQAYVPSIEECQLIADLFADASLSTHPFSNNVYLLLSSTEDPASPEQVLAIRIRTTDGVSTTERTSIRKDSASTVSYTLPIVARIKIS